MEAANLYFKEGTSDKVYHATIEKEGEGYVVNFAYGRRGSALTTGSKTSSPVALEKAKSIFNKLVGEKMAKGYRHIEGATGEGSIPVAKDLPDTPTEIQCVLLNPIEEKEAMNLLKNDDWAAQPKLDGVRFMLRKQKSAVTALNRKGKQASVPNNIAAAAARIESDFFIDGELIGSSYHIFDILEHDGKCLRKKSLTQRIKALESLVEGIGSDLVFVGIHLGKDKKVLYDSLLKENKEGIVFKHLDAHYNVGRPASGGNYLKHKFYSTCSCVVTEANQKRSVAVALEGVGVGNVTIPSNFDVPKKGDVVEVKYLYAYKGGSLYQPIYLGKRSDIDADECLLAQLKYKSED
jgi:bifunctional non-homologous end joining protein LigD